MVTDGDLVGAQLFDARDHSHDDRTDEQAADQAKAGFHKPGHGPAKVLNEFHHVVDRVIRPV